LLNGAVQSLRLIDWWLYQSSIEEVDFTSPRGLDKNQLLRLASCQFLEKQENIIITGPTGVGYVNQMIM